MWGTNKAFDLRSFRLFYGDCHSLQPAVLGNATAGGAGNLKYCRHPGRWKEALLSGILSVL